MIRASLLAALEQESSICFVLDEQFTILHTNAAWTPSALRDHAAPINAHDLIGKPYLSHVEGPLSGTLEVRMRALTSPNHTARVATVVESECNTPQLFRRLSTHVMPVALTEEETGPHGVVVLQALRVVGPLQERYEFSDDSPELWRAGERFFKQCSCCRRGFDARRHEWRANPAIMVRSPPNTSHAICDSCLEIYYP